MQTTALQDGSQEAGKRKNQLMALAEEHQSRLAMQAEQDFNDTNRTEFLKKKQRYAW